MIISMTNFDQRPEELSQEKNSDKSVDKLKGYDMNCLMTSPISAKIANRKIGNLKSFLPLYISINTSRLPHRREEFIMQKIT